jgi:dihydrolipoamide dehydrogenase
LEYKVGKFNFQANGKALGLGETAGFAKIIADANSGELLGAHLIGPEVSELLPELTLAKNSELTVEEIASNVHAHPTLSEVLMEASLAVNGKAIQA